MSNSPLIEDGVLTLGPNLDIAHAAELKAAMAGLLAHEGALALDGSKVIRSDAAGLQLLLAFTRQCRAGQRAWRWREASEVLRMDAAGLGLARDLDFLSPDQGGSQ